MREAPKPCLYIFPLLTIRAILRYIWPQTCNLDQEEGMAQSRKDRIGGRAVREEAVAETHVLSSKRVILVELVNS